MSDSIDNELYRSVGRLVFSILNRDPIGVQMSALTDALAAMKARIDEDVAHLRSLLDEALAANAGDDAEIARLTAEFDAVSAEVSNALGEINAIDPDASFPAAPPAPPVEEPAPAPVEPTN